MKNIETLAMVDALKDSEFGTDDIFTMDEQRAQVRIVRNAGGVTERKGNRVNWHERETFGLEYTDATHFGRYNGACFGTLAEMLRHCKAKEFYVVNADAMLAIESARQLREADIALRAA